MRLWYRPGSAAMAPHAALAEAGAEYELAHVDWDDPADAPAEYRRLNPQGRVPTLEDDGLVLTESAAILLYLAEKFPEARLLPADLRDRAEAYRWLLFLTNTVQPAFMRAAYPHRYGSDADREAAALAEHYDLLDRRLEGREWLAGPERSVADLFGFMLVRWGRRFDPPAWARPNLRAFVLRSLELPGVVRTLDEQGLERPSL
jgi:glutathione S-transferase